MQSDAAATISSLMGKAERGDSSAAEALFVALYAELHRLAKRELARQGAVISLGPTTLLHEAYLDIAARGGPSFPDQARFMGYAARVTRGLIIDHARRRCAVKRGGQFEITRLGTEPAGEFADERELTPISAALDELAKADAARPARRPEILLRILVRRNRCHAGRIGTHGATKMGQGAHLSPPQCPRSDATVRN